MVVVVVVVIVKIGKHRKIRNVAVWVTAVVANRGQKWLKGGSKVGRMANRWERGQCGNGRRWWWAAVAGWWW
jgi:hypothetical protein